MSCRGQKWHCQNWITIGYHETVQTRWLLAEQGKVSGTAGNGGDGRLFIDLLDMKINTQMRALIPDVHFGWC